MVNYEARLNKRGALATAVSLHWLMGRTSRGRQGEVWSVGSVCVCVCERVCVSVYVIAGRRVLQLLSAR